jgi:DNA-binding NtrC family response regulator
VGGTRPTKLDVRIVAATNRNLTSDVREGRFREDLYFRLNGVTLRLPPLRERPRDVALLARHFLDAEAGPKKTPGPAALAKLQSYSWPGNVRELQMLMRRPAALSTAEILEPDDFPIGLASSSRKAAFRSNLTLAELEEQHIKSVLEENGGHRGRTARALGIDAKTQYNRLGPERPRRSESDPSVGGAKMAAEQEG